MFTLSAPRTSWGSNGSFTMWKSSYRSSICGESGAGGREPGVQAPQPPQHPPHMALGRVPGIRAPQIPPPKIPFPSRARQGPRRPGSPHVNARPDPLPGSPNSAPRPLLLCHGPPHRGGTWSRYLAWILCRASHILQGRCGSGKTSWFTTMLWVSMRHLASSWISRSVS